MRPQDLPEWTSDRLRDIHGIPQLVCDHLADKALASFNVGREEPVAKEVFHPGILAIDGIFSYLEDGVHLAQRIISILPIQKH